LGFLVFIVTGTCIIFSAVTIRYNEEESSDGYIELTCETK
jgi:hypothetical protein